MSVFRFKKFHVVQEKSAMKVGTDGVLLGSWVSSKKRNNILDIGCGTGLIALMLAQRNQTTNIIGIEIDKEASEEAQLNVNCSRWTNRINIENIPFQRYTSKIKFDLIVSNPPFFPKNHSNNMRDIARHANALSFEELIQNSAFLLSEGGIFSVIIPKDSEAYFCEVAKSSNLFPARVCYVKGNELSDIKRVMIEFSFLNQKIQQENLVIEKERHKYTDDYISLCKPFYLHM